MPWHSGVKKQLAVTESRSCRAVSIVAYQELFCLVPLLASSIKHANDFGGNEKINKKATGWISETKTLNMQHTIWQPFFAAIAQLTVSNLIVVTSIPVGEVNTFTESL